MKPGKLDLDIYRGDTCDVYFMIRGKNADGTPGAYTDLTGATAKAQIRATSDSPTVIAEFVATIDDQVARTGGVLLHLDPTVTAAITDTKGVWDCQITDASGDVNTYLAGAVAITGDVTK